jgi:hypothetical protein
MCGSTAESSADVTCDDTLASAFAILRGCTAAARKSRGIHAAPCPRAHQQLRQCGRDPFTEIVDLVERRIDDSPVTRADILMVQASITST